jgi:dipeptidyl aminopeptidase/acylaminoacyl peptidase
MTPEFSPNRRRVAFRSDRSGAAEIWTADPDGQNSVQVTSLGAPLSGDPHWSPDGKLIAFNSNAEHQYESYVVPAAGGTPRNVTNHPANDEAPSFSADGASIYFTSDRSGKYEVWKLPVSGGAAVQVTHEGGFKAIESSDGAALYYTTTTGPVPSPLWRLPNSGGRPVKIADGVIRRAFRPTADGVYYIDLPPGEARNVGISSRSRLQFLQTATGKTLTVALNLGEIFNGLTASADGRTILYSRVDYQMDLMLVEHFR